MPGWWTNERQRYALDYLTRNGLSLFGAAGLVSRWANVESTAQGPFSQGGYKGRAFGIAQWLGSRLPSISGNTNFDAQLAYVIKELNGSEARAGNMLRSAATVQEGARGASMYERAGGYNAATGIDSYTAKTAAGLPATYALLGGRAPSNVAQASPDQNPLPADITGAPQSVGIDESGGADINTQDLNEAGIGGSGILLLAAIAVVYYLFSD